MDLASISKMLVVSAVFFSFFISVADLGIYRSSVIDPFLEKHGRKVDRDEFRKLFGMWDVFMMRREMEALRQIAPHDVDAGRMVVELKRRIVITSSCFLLLLPLILPEMIRQAMA